VENRQEPSKDPLMGWPSRSSPFFQFGWKPSGPTHRLSRRWQIGLGVLLYNPIVVVPCLYLITRSWITSGLIGILISWVGGLLFVVIAALLRYALK